MKKLMRLAVSVVLAVGWATEGWAQDRPHVINGSYLTRTDLYTGVVEFIGDTGYDGIIDIATSPDGLLYGIDYFDDTLVQIDTVTGAASEVGPLGVDVRVFFGQDGLTFDACGRLWFLDASERALYSVDPQTGLATEAVTLSGQVVGPITARGPHVVAAPRGSGQSTYVEIDPVVGTQFPTNISLLGEEFDFEPSGERVWGIAAVFLPPFPVDSYIGYRDVVTDQMVITVEPYFQPIAAMSFGPPIGICGAVDIPAMDDSGRFVLVALLAVASLFLLRRRSLSFGRR